MNRLVTLGMALLLGALLLLLASGQRAAAHLRPARDPAPARSHHTLPGLRFTFDADRVSLTPLEIGHLMVAGSQRYFAT
jgi:hypothetical protein